MEKFIQRPSIDLYEGITVTKDTFIEYESENVTQVIQNLILHSITMKKGEGFESTYHTTIYLNEGDVLIFDGDERGYIKPLYPFVTVDEAIRDLTALKN